eukprot:CAMPEP_0170483186 /NCGR_PEP_ID=MMETSP0208-20121228/2913_1 /TAXON_ID=197538 /ORGANISM="Strombidium inclinatum, Strain S3" /LENGTH=89 /DNA_ID=CAMNT_0010756131 /DNA_START=650 /DNA_END=919 /DNA_ORIENTATION=+
MAGKAALLRLTVVLLSGYFIGDHLPDFISRVRFREAVLADGLSNAAGVAAAGADAAVGQSASQPQVTNLDLAILIDEDVRGLKVSVQNI